MSDGRWTIRKVQDRWAVLCPADASAWDWTNDFGRGQCRCRVFKRWTLARNYVFKRMATK